MKASVEIKGQTPSSFIPAFVKLSRVAADEFTISVAEEMREYLIEAITTQRYNWKPLSENYLKKKRNDPELDERIYIATGFFLDHIDVWEDQDGVHVGFHPGVIHEPSGLPLNVLARILEFGSAKVGIPARPLWRPALSAVMRRQKEFARRMRISAAKNAKTTKQRMKDYHAVIKGKS